MESYVKLSQILSLDVIHAVATSTIGHNQLVYWTQPQNLKSSPACLLSD